MIISGTGAHLAVKLSETRAMRRFGAKMYPVLVPGCENLEFISDEYMECLTRHLTATIYHPVGTAKMGPKTDPEAVVDPQLRCN